MVQVKTFKSVGAKLFYYMSALVLLVIAGNSWQFAKTFITYQKEQVQNAIQAQAQGTADRIVSEIEVWKAQIATALPSFRSLDGKEVELQIKRFLQANPELVALSIFEAPSFSSTKVKLIGSAFTPHQNDTRFEARVPSEVWSKIQGVSRSFLTREIKVLKKENVGIDSIAKSTKLPLMIMAARFEVSGSKSVIWAVLVTWQTNILKALSSSADTEIVVVDRKGKVFSSVKSQKMVERQPFPSRELVRRALKGDRPSDFVDEYHTDEGRRLGAFNRVPQYRVSVLVEKDAERAYTALKQNLISTALWATLFILIAVMFAYIGATGITKGLREVTYATRRIASGDFRYRIKPVSEDEVAELGVAVNTMSAKIVELLSTQVEKARFEKELETARMVQSTFFPKADIRLSHLTVSGFYQPASECGGDLWGHFAIDDGIDFIFIADAMGHGAPAALVTAMAYSTTMTIADIIKDRTGHGDSPARILDRANRIIYEAVRGTISMTFFACIVNTRNGTITYANAGHNFPLLIPTDPADDRVGKARKGKGVPLPISLKLMGTPLGMDPATVYKDQSMELKPGDKLFLFTDGLIECTSPEGKVWGRKYLVELIAEGASMKGEGLKDEVVAKAFQFFATKPLDDDVTVVVAELGKDWVPQAEPAPALEPIPVVEPRGHAMPPPAPAPQQAAEATLDLDMGFDLALDASLATPTATQAPAPAPAPAAHEERPMQPQPSQQPEQPQQQPQAPAPQQPERRVQTNGKYKIKLPSAG